MYPEVPDRSKDCSRCVVSKSVRQEEGLREVLCPKVARMTKHLGRFIACSGPSQEQQRFVAPKVVKPDEVLREAPERIRHRGGLVIH